MGKKADMTVQIKGLVQDIKSVNACGIENIKNVKLRFIDSNISKENYNCLNMICELLMNTYFTSLESKLYFKDMYIQYSGVVEELKLNYGVECTVANVGSKVYYDKQKIVRTFGSSMLVDLAIIGKDNYKKYSKVILTTLESYRGYNDAENIVLEINDIDSEIEFDISEDRLNEQIDILVPYTKKYMEAVKSNLDKEVIAYIRYLLACDNLTGQDRKRSDNIKELLNSESL